MDPVDRLASNYRYLTDGPHTKADWVLKTQGSTYGIGLSYPKNRVGAFSLYDLAFRQLLRNLELLGYESLVGVPWSFASTIWEAVCRHQLDSLAVWKVFAAAYPDGENDALKRRYKVLKPPPMDFEDVIIKPICSSSFQWVNFLTITTLNLTRLELLQLPKLSNLGALTIGPNEETRRTGTATKTSGRSSLGTDVVRAWADHCAEAGAFSQLRVLVLRSIKTLDAIIFQYLNQFPVLSVFAFQDCPFSHRDEAESSKYSWRFYAAEEIDDYVFPGKTEKTTWDSTLQTLFDCAIRDRLRTTVVEDGSLVLSDESDLPLMAGPSVPPSEHTNLPQTQAVKPEPVEATSPAEQPEDPTKDLPRFHLVVGAAPKGPKDIIFAKTCTSLHCFFQETRIIPSNVGPSKRKPVTIDPPIVPKEDLPLKDGSKRKVAEKNSGGESSTKKAKKTPSKLVAMEDTLAQFGSGG